jgi:hypothetical protein
MQIRIPKVSLSIGWNAYNETWGIRLSWGKKDGPEKQLELNYLHSMGVEIRVFKF